MNTRNVTMYLFWVTVCAAPCAANPNAMWTWVSGSSTNWQFGVYGTKGVAASGNVPGARSGSVSWIDIDAGGDLWLFGGFGYVAGGAYYLNDLWKYDGANWTWVSGSNGADQYGVYGTKGVVDSNNMPGARNYSVSWSDAGANFWLFGGFGRAASGYSSYLNDLWRFDGTNWTWVSGSNGVDQYGVYGTKGVAASANMPGARYYSISWTDAGGNLWLFGGKGCAASGSADYLNDLWKFDGADWTWVSGAGFTNQYGIYGTRGIAASGNSPGARYGSISWIDGSGNLWLFGGSGYAASGIAAYLNDLWKFDGTNWTWVSGSNTTDQYGVYGTKGLADSGNVPGARAASVSWTDAGGNLWLFGGEGYPANGISGTLNDLWKFDGANWTWVSGSNATARYGVYGTKGVAAPGNVPGSRYGSVSWTDCGDNLVFFGGFGYAASTGSGALNDLWKFGIPDEAADMVEDGVIDELDLAELIDQWLGAPGEPSADLAPNPAGDNTVDFRDFAVLARMWLEAAGGS